MTQRKAWKPWLMFMLEGVHRTARYTNDTIDEILLQMEATYTHARKKLRWYSPELNQALFSQPYIKQKTVGEVTGTKSRTTLTRYMHELVRLGVVSRLEDGREVFFINNDLLRILQK